MIDKRKPNGRKCIECDRPLIGRQMKNCSQSCSNRQYEKRKGKKPPAFVRNDVAKSKQRYTFNLQQMQSNPNSISFREPVNEIVELKRQLSYWQGLLKDAKEGVYSFATLLGGGIGASIPTTKKSRSGRTKKDPIKKVTNVAIGALVGRVADNWRQKTDIRNAEIAIHNLKSRIEGLEIANEMVAKRKELVRNQNRVNLQISADQPKIERTDSYTAINADELSKIKRVTHKLDGKWKYFLGDEIEQGFSALIYGAPKAGKSHFAIQFAEYLRQNFGKVAYFAAEEGNSKTIEIKAQKWGAKFPIVYNVNGTKGIDDYIKNHDPKFIFFDSINRLGIGYDSLKFYIDEFPDKSWFFISQSTKTNGFRGSQEIKHLVDAVVEAVKGVAYQDGRLNAKTELNIFD